MCKREEEEIVSYLGCYQNQVSRRKENVYLADAVDKRWGNVQRKSKEKNPKLPGAMKKKESKIFFTKLLKEKGTSVAVLENFDK